MNHPFELELSQLKSVNLKIENLDVEEITDEKLETIAGGCRYNPWKPPVSKALFEQGGFPPKPVITQACYETGCGDNTSALLGESAEGPRF